MMEYTELLIAFWFQLSARENVTDRHLPDLTSRGNPSLLRASFFNGKFSNSTAPESVNTDLHLIVDVRCCTNCTTDAKHLNAQF